MKITWNASKNGTIGIEEEFLLVDKSGDTVSRALEIVEKTPNHLPLQPELFASMIEQASPVLANYSEVAGYLKKARSDLSEYLTGHGLRALSRATHPTANPLDVAITNLDRYQAIRERYGLKAQRQLVLGLHVHYGVKDKEKAIRIANYIRQFIPELLALSANGSYWRNLNTGCASIRPLLLNQLPRTGVPPYWENWKHYENWISEKQSEDMPDYTYTWWDVRLHPKYGTVEVRVFDAQPTVENVSAFVEIIHCLAQKAESEEVLVKDTDELKRRRHVAAREGLANTELRLSTQKMIESLPLSKATTQTIQKLLDRIDDEPISAQDRLESTLAVFTDDPL